MRKASRSTRYFSSKQEKAVARAVSGKQVSNSGATRFKKGDVENDAFLIECKTKTSPSKTITIQKEWFDKIKREAFEMGKPYSAVVFDFGDSEQHYVIDSYLFEVLNETINNYLKENIL